MKGNQIKTAGLIKSLPPDYLAMVKGFLQVLLVFLFLEEYSKDVSIYAELYSMPFSNQNMEMTVNLFIYSGVETKKN